jgi:RNA polymerase sigma-70 factor (ECF subfamily)
VRSPEDAARAVAAGDAAAFRVVVDALGGALFRLLARMLGDAAAAEDVLQDVLLRAFQAMRAGRFDGGAALRTWLHRIAINAAVDTLRHRARRRDDSTALVEPSAHAPVATLEARCALHRLAALLDDLPLEQRSALVLKELEGLSSAEVAAALGISEGAVEQRLVRARATLRRRLPEIP